MFDAVRNNKLIVQGFLALITLPFAFWGVDSYVRNASSGIEVAKVGASKITVPEFQEALREEGDRMRQQQRDRFDPHLLETPAARRAVLNGLINQRLLTLASKDSHLMVSDDVLARFIAQVPALQEDGKFSPERYQALVASRGLTTEGFEARLRQDMALQQLVQPLGDAAIVSKTVAARWASGQLEQRAVAEFRLAPEAYVKQVNLAPDAVEKFYAANRTKFEVPEQARVDYVVLDQEGLQQQVTVLDSDVEARYKAHPERYKQAETRRASHILLTLPKDAKEADVQAAQKKADTILAQLKVNPKAFAELAKKYSQDPGSAQNGGDLDWFGRGAMVKPFEDAVFALKQDEISPVVRSDFGLHIIHLTGIKPERETPFADVKADILAEIKREAATRKFAEAVEAFTNMVYEQPDTLQPAADQWKLPIQHSAWLRKGDAMPAPFDNQKLQTAIFGDDAIAKKHNTEAVEVTPGRLVSARVVEYRPASIQPLDAVKASVVQQLTLEKASEMAIADGEKRLEALRTGKVAAGNGDEKWGPTRQVLRAAPQGLPQDAAREIFAADAAKLPAYVGARSPEGGYTLYKVIGSTPAAKDDPRSAMLAQQYTRLVAAEEFASWLSSLRSHYEVKINDKVLDRKER